MSRLDIFLTEATFSKTDLPKVVNILVKVVERAAGMKLSPMGGQGNNTEKFKKSNGNTGIGMRYIADSGIMIRFNLYTNQKSGQVSSVDIFKLDGDLNKADLTLNLPSELNSIELAKTIGNWIKTPRKGQVKLVENVIEQQIKMLSEVKQTPENLALSRKFGIDIDLPAAEFKRKVMETVTMMATNGVTEVSDLSTAISDAQDKLDKQKYADPDVVFKDLDDLVGMVAGGFQPSLLITGQAGIGKCLSGNSNIPVRFND